MNLNSTNFHNILEQWGQAQAQMPANHKELKAAALNTLAVEEAPKNIHNTPRLPWLTLAFSAMAVTILVVQVTQNNFSVPTSTLQNTSSEVLSKPYISGPGSPTAPAPKAIPAPSPLAQRQAAGIAPLDSTGSDRFMDLPTVQNEVPISDTRQFEKTNYFASVQSHNLLDLSGRLQNTILGFGGRVDSFSVSENSGAVAFVLPVSELENFRKELKNLAGGRFVKEQLQSENLLPQKIDIENQQKVLQQQITDLQDQKKQLTQEHNKTIGLLKAEIASANAQLDKLQNQTPQTQEEFATIQTQIQDTKVKISSLQYQLSNENNNYEDSISSYNSQIQNSQAGLGQASEQTNNLSENVATVSGTINLSYISLWDIFNSYAGLWWVVILLAVAAVISYFATSKNKFILP